MESNETLNNNGDRCWPGPQGPLGPKVENFRIRTAVVCNHTCDTLTEGNAYLVYRKHEQTGEPTYSLCTYENGCWIPYGIIESIKRLPWFTGVPVSDEDWWICANAAFNDELIPVDIVEKTDENVGKNAGKETVQEFVERRRAEIAQEEQEQRRKADQEKFESIRRGEYTPHRMPITPSPESLKIHELNITINILMEYIQKMQDDIIDEPVIEQNWNHVKELTNDMLDRIGELEEKVKNMQFIPVPCVPVDPISPITPGYPNPNPSVPGYPFGPIITYSVPGQGPICTSAMSSTLGEVKYVTDQK